MHKAPLLALFAVLVALAVPALAANPDKGEVSKANVQVKWTGSTDNGAATTITAISNGGTVACVAPSCDTFALTVKDSDQLTITSTSGVPFNMVEVVLPDGSKIYNGGEETSNTTQVQIPAAVTGAYEIHLAQNSLTPQSYTAMAVLGPVDSKGRPAGAAPTSTPTAPPQGAPPEPQNAQPGATMTIKTRKASAKKVAKKLKVSVSTTGPVTGVTVKLRKGTKVLGTGKIARIDKTATITIKLKKKLKAGKYTINVVGKDSGGRAVGATAPLKAKK